MGGEGDRFMEVWNIVFSQFNNDGHGNYSDLVQKNIDTGMGLERLAVIVQDVDSIFDIDTLVSLRDEVCRMAHEEYHRDEQKDISIRIIVDHIRSATFMISDGIMPSNEGRGYVLRRLIRRAARHGRMLGIEKGFLAELSGTVADDSKDAYPELEERREFIYNVLKQEEDKFDRTIDQGMNILSDMEDKMEKQGTTVLSGEDAFTLYDTYGFPLDLTEEILCEKGCCADEEGFEECMKRQRDAARSARSKTNYMGADATVYDQIPIQITTEFDGYDTLKEKAKITVMTTGTELTEALTDGQQGTIVTDRTPFYGTMGGQVGDHGIIECQDGRFQVEETIHLRGGRIGHVGSMVSGMLRVGDTVTMQVNERDRRDTEKNHSATHLLQKALKVVLGSHVEQKGSYVDPTRLRFDFSHFQPMTAEELQKVEDIVNREIEAALLVRTDIMSLDDAKKTGAMALFGEKYGDKVRVVSMGDFSRELCGGTHVSNTSEIKNFKILSEAGVAAGVRRIEALTGSNVIDYYRGKEEEVAKAAELLKTQPSEVLEKIETLQAELKKAQAEIESLKSEAAKKALGDVSSDVRQIKGVGFIARKLEGVDANGLRELGDSLKEQLGEGVVVLASVSDGKVQLMATATDGAVKKGAHAGNLIKAIARTVGGGGGGRPSMAMAGGKNPAGVDEALKLAETTLESQMKD